MSWLPSFSSPNPNEPAAARKKSKSSKKKKPKKREENEDDDDHVDDDGSSDDDRRERDRKRREKEEERQRDEEEDLSRRDRLTDRERQDLERLDRKRARERNLRFEDKDDEAARVKKAEREAERKAEEEAREALRAENEMVQVQEAVAADDQERDDLDNLGAAAPKRVVMQYLGDMDIKFNNDATHMIWSALKAAVFLVIFGWALANSQANVQVGSCTTSTLVPWCVGGFTATSGDNVTFCRDRTGDCLTQCVSIGQSLPTAGCYTKPMAQGSVPAITDLVCHTPAEFQAKCDNRLSCNSKYITAVQSGYTPGAVMFFFMLALEALHALGLFMWTAIHPDDVGSETRTRAMRALLIMVKSYPFLAQLLTLVTAFCWIFLYISYNAGFDYCSSALTQTASKLTIFTQTRAFMICYVVALVVVCTIGTYLRKFRPIRGELYNPSVDGELTPPCNSDFKDMRERPAPRMCPELWADCEDPDARVMCKPCATPCKHFWNLVFAVFLAPLGWLIEMFFRHRHFIGP